MPVVTRWLGWVFTNAEPEHNRPRGVNHGAKRGVTKSSKPRRKK